jgi:hypothetical protein
MAKVFISYRHGDSWGAVGSLRDAVAAEFGRENVFFDVDAIPVGMDFRVVLRDAISRTDVMLVLIGLHWASMTDHEGRRRLDNPHDFVRLEVEQALQTSVPVVPVLLDGASLPHADQVPGSLMPLLTRSGVALSPQSFEADLRHLVRMVASMASKVEDQPTQPGRQSEASPWKLKVVSTFASMLGIGSALEVRPRGGNVGTAGSIDSKPIPARPVKTSAAEEVFISYSREDLPLMERVRKRLDDSQITVWTDAKLQPGTPSWKRAVQDAIESSSCFIILLTPSAKNSEVVQMELGYALAHERIVLPVLAQGTNRTAVPLEIINRQWTDITESRFDDGTRLVEAVVAYRAGRLPSL